MYNDLIQLYFDSMDFRTTLLEKLGISDEGSTIILEDIDVLNSGIINVNAEIEGGSQKYKVQLQLSLKDNIIESYKIIETEDIAEQEIRRDKLNFDIDYWSYNITYDQLARMFENGKILVPDMQRGFVWDHIQASKLIESILMGLPLPSLFLIKLEDSSYLVVDGLQRITTIHAFRYNRKLPNSKSGSAGFALKGVNADLNGKTYNDLNSFSSMIDRFDMGTINVIEFKQSKPDYEEAMYSLFERLNSGGTSLTDQQIRNSIYYGLFNRSLNNFAKKHLEKYFSVKATLGLIPSEVILRAVSIYDFVFSHYETGEEIDCQRINEIISFVLVE